MRLEEIRIRDPFLLQDGGSIYLYGTTDVNTWSGKGEGFDCYVTEDLREFKGPFPAFRRTEELWADENFWAPEVWRLGDKFYMIASCKKAGRRRGIQIFEADTPKGPFVPVVNRAVTPPDWDCLDGTLYFEGEKVYMIFSHEWTQVGDGEICVVQMDPSLQEMESDPAVLFRASEAGWTVAHTEFGKTGYVTDGPFVIRKDGRLEMIWSSYSKSGYSLGLAYSEDGLFGEWKHEKRPVFAQDGGHGMIFAHGGKEWLVLHRPNELYRERVCFVEWTVD